MICCLMACMSWRLTYCPMCKSQLPYQETVQQKLNSLQLNNYCTNRRDVWNDDDYNIALIWRRNLKAERIACEATGNVRIRSLWIEICQQRVPLSLRSYDKAAVHEQLNEICAGAERPDSPGFMPPRQSSEWTTVKSSPGTWCKTIECVCLSSQSTFSTYVNRYLRNFTTWCGF